MKNTQLQVHDRTETTAYVSTEDGKHEAKYRLEDGTWVFEATVYGDLEEHLETQLGSQQAAWDAIDAALK